MSYLVKEDIKLHKSSGEGADGPLGSVEYQEEQSSNSNSPGDGKRKKKKASNTVTEFDDQNCSHKKKNKRKKDRRKLQQQHEKGLVGSEEMVDPAKAEKRSKSKKKRPQNERSSLEEKVTVESRHSRNKKKQPHKSRNQQGEIVVNQKKHSPPSNARSRRQRQIRNYDNSSSEDDNDDFDDDDMSDRPGAFAIESGSPRCGAGAGAGEIEGYSHQGDTAATSTALSSPTLPTSSAITTSNIIEAEIAPDVDEAVEHALQVERQRQEEMERERQNKVVTATAVEIEAKARIKMILKIVVVVLLLVGIVLAITLSLILPIESDNEPTQKTIPSPTNDSIGEPPSNEDTLSPTLITDMEVDRTWVKMGDDIVAPQEVAKFGSFVSLSSPGKVAMETSMNRLAISAIGGSMDGMDGYVFVYDVSADGGLTQMGNAIASGSTGGRFLGDTLQEIGAKFGDGARGCLSGDGSRLVVAEPQYVGDDVDADFVGRVRAFELNVETNMRRNALETTTTISGTDCINCNWELLGDPIYPIDNSVGGSRKSIAVALSWDGSMLAIASQIGDGAYIGKMSRLRNRRLDTIITGPSASYFHQIQCFQYQDGLWLEFGSPIELDDNLDKSGYSISISEDGLTVAIAIDYVISSQGLGRVDIYRYNVGEAGQWTMLGNPIEGSFSWQGDYFGIEASLSSDGETVAIAALGTFSSGGAAVFSYDDVDDEWYQMGGDLEGDVGSNDVIDKVSLSSNGRRVAISSTWRDDSYVYVYEHRRGNWIQVGQKLLSERPGEQFGDGLALSSSGNLLAVGSSVKYGRDDQTPNVRLYSLKVAE